MTAEEIRKVFAQAVQKPGMTAEALQTACLCEIAAQLAELNERLKPGNLEANIFDCTYEGRTK